MPYQAEYIWIDGAEPTPMLRSKTKVLADNVTTPPMWGFDGSSTEQATGDKSDCGLKPVFTCPDPIRGGKNILVLCEVIMAQTGEPHPTNTRAACVAAAEKYKSHEMIYGIEQEYTMMRIDGDSAQPARNATIPVTGRSGISIMTSAPSSSSTAAIKEFDVSFATRSRWPGRL